MQSSAMIIWKVNQTAVRSFVHAVKSGYKENPVRTVKEKNIYNNRAESAEMIEDWR